MLELDVTSEESVSGCVSDVLERAGRIDVLVNNAGVGLLGAIEETLVEEAAALGGRIAHEPPLPAVEVMLAHAELACLAHASR